MFIVQEVGVIVYKTGAEFFRGARTVAFWGASWWTLGRLRGAIPTIERKRMSMSGLPCWQQFSGSDSLDGR